MKDSIDLRPLPLGRQLLLRRIALGLSQGQMAELVGAHQSRISEDSTGGRRLCAIWTLPSAN